MLRLWKRTQENVERDVDSTDRPCKKYKPNQDVLDWKPPTEAIIIYDNTSESKQNELSQKLLSINFSKKAIRAVGHVLSELGPHACDLYWRRIKPTLEIASGIEANSTQMQVMDTLKSWDFNNSPNLDPHSKKINGTPKFLKLIEILKSCEPSGDAFRALIFVHRRVVALALADVLHDLSDKLPFVRPCAMVSSNKMPHQEQLAVFREFETGSVNVIIATRSYQDIGKHLASVVINFDVFDSVVSQAYFRAQCRSSGHFVQMVAQNSMAHRRSLTNLTVDSSVRQWMNDVANSEESSGPPRSLRKSRDAYYSDSDEDDQSPEDYIKDPITSSRIYIQDATDVIYQYLAQSSSHCREPIFSFTQNDSMNYICTLDVPGTDIEGINGAPCASMAHARRQACYQACLKLFHCGRLDYRLFPKSGNGLHSNQSSGSVGSHSTTVPSTAHGNPLPPNTQIYFKKQPEFWSNTLSLPIGFLYPFVIYTEDVSRKCAPLCIIMRQPLPRSPDIHLFLDGSAVGFKTMVAKPLLLDDIRLEKIRLYTLRICRAVTQRPITCEMQDMPYFLAPLKADWQRYSSGGMDLIDEIPWTLVDQAATSWVVKIDMDSIDDDLHDAIVQDRFTEFTRRFEVVDVRHDLNPFSKPEDSLREAGHESILDFTKSIRNSQEELKDACQPLIQVDKFLAVRNFFTPEVPVPLPKSRPPTKYLIPEFCAKSTVPASIFRTATILPCILRRIDEILIVKELNSTLFNHGISEQHLHTAISTPSAQTKYNYERLEFLGDSFIKYAASVYCFCTQHFQAEAALHIARSKIVSNQSLLHEAIRVGLPAFIQGVPFKPKFCFHPNFVDVPPQKSVPLQAEASTQETIKSKNPNFVQQLGDKTVADVSEAIVGAAYLSGGCETALQAVKALSTLFAKVDQWSDFERLYRFPISKMSEAQPLKASNALQALLGYTFPPCKSQLLLHALSTSGNAHERLEWLGDAVLDLFVVQRLFERFPDLPPGGLTMLKTAMICNPALSSVCVASGLYQHIFFESHKDSQTVHIIARQLRTRQEEEDRLAISQSRPHRQYWLDIEIPKILGDVLEGTIGALYVSNGFNNSAAKAFFDKIILPFFEKYVSLATLSVHPIATFYQLLHTLGCYGARLDVSGRFRCHVILHETVLVKDVFASTKSLAVRKACNIALDLIQNTSNLIDTICNCREKQLGLKAKKKMLQEVGTILAEDKSL